MDPCEALCCCACACLQGDVMWQWSLMNACIVCSEASCVLLHSIKAGLVRSNRLVYNETTTSTAATRDSTVTDIMLRFYYYYLSLH